MCIHANVHSAISTRGIARMLRFFFFFMVAQQKLVLFFLGALPLFFVVIEETHILMSTEILT